MPDELKNATVTNPRTLRQLKEIGDEWGVQMPTQVIQRLVERAHYIEVENKKVEHRFATAGQALPSETKPPPQ